MTRIAKKGGGFRELTPEEAKVRKSGNLVSLSGAKGGVEVLTTDETEANKVHLRLLDLKQRYQDTQIEIGALLYRVSEERLFTAKSLGAHETFKDYVEGELKMGIRKAQMLAGNHWWYAVKHKDEPKMLEGARQIGWTKANHLVKVVDVKNADKWFDMAKSMNEKELLQHVRAAVKAAGKKRDRRIKETKPSMNPPAGMTPDDPEPDTPTTEEAEANGQVVTDDEPEESAGIDPPTEEQVEEVKAKDQEWTTFSMRVPADTVDSIKEAVSLAKKVAATGNDGYALSLVAQHFLSFSHDKVTVMIGEWLAWFERNTGLKVIAVDPRDEKIVYGKDTLAATEDEEE